MPNLPRLGVGGNSESLGSAGKLVLTHSGMPLGPSSQLLFKRFLLAWHTGHTAQGIFLIHVSFPRLVGFFFSFSFREIGSLNSPNYPAQHWVPDRRLVGRWPA